MANNIPGRQQFEVAANFIKTRPARAGPLLVFVAIGFLVTRKYDPFVIRYSAHFGEPAREIETLVLINPNVDKREIVLHLLRKGNESHDFGLDEDVGAVAMDLSSKKWQSAKLSLLERSVSIVNIVHDDLGDDKIRIIPGPSEMEPSTTMMRSIAFAYLISLLLLLTGYLSGISSAVGALTFVSNPRDLIEKLRKLFSTGV